MPPPARKVYTEPRQLGPSISSNMSVLRDTSSPPSPPTLLLLTLVGEETEDPVLLELYLNRLSGKIEGVLL